MNKNVCEKVMEKSWARLSTVAALSLFLEGCLIPELRGIRESVELKQNDLIYHEEFLSHNDMVARADTMLIDGTRVDQVYSPTINSSRETFSQVPLFTNSFNNTFYQINTNDTSSIQLDLLLVMDNSGSMANEQDLIANNFDNLLNEVDHVNWRIAIATTSSDEFGTLRGMVTKGDFATNAEALAQLMTYIVVGTDGSGNERHIASVVNVLLDNPNSFLRSGALFRTIFVSDEDSCSTGTNVMDPAADPARVGATPTRCRLDWDGADAALDVADQIIGNAELIQFYGIYWVPGEAQGNTGHANEANVLHEVVTRSGGFAKSIWSSDYADVLQDIGQSSVAPITEYRLDHPPIPGTVAVSVNGVLIDPADYSISGERIIFNGAYVPPSEAEITVAYMAGQDPQTDFTLSQTPIVSSIDVYVNGVQSSDWTYVNGNIIRFNNAVAESAAIQVDFDLMPAPVTAYDLSANPPAMNGVVVYENGTALAASRVSVANNIVTLDPPAGALSEVQINYLPLSEVATSMNLSATPLIDAQFGLGVRVLQNGQEVPNATYDAGLNRVSLDPTTLLANVEVEVHYSERSTMTDRLALSYDVLPMTFAIKENGVTVSPEEYSIDGNQVVFNEPLPPFADYDVTYYEPGDLKTKFKIENRNDLPIIGVLEVEVDEETLSSDDYVFDPLNKELIFDVAPMPGATIVVWFEASNLTEEQLREVIDQQNDVEFK